jgi:hypothetical protein
VLVSACYKLVSSVSLLATSLCLLASDMCLLATSVSLFATNVSLRAGKDCLLGCYKHVSVCASASVWVCARAQLTYQYRRFVCLLTTEQYSSFT